MESLTPEKLQKLMQYSFAVTEESVGWKGFKINFIRDECPENPHDRGDCMAPALWTYSDGGLSSDHGKGLSRVIDEMDSRFVSRHWRKIADILNISESEVEKEVKAWRDSIHDLGEWRKEYFAERLTEIRDYQSDSKYLAALAALYNLRGIPAFLMETLGYCQGDFSRVLIVLTPEWAELVGCPYAMPGKIDPEKCEKDARGQLAELSAWMWGDVYGYTIKSGGKTLDSCFGFYGSNPIESGILDAVCETVNCEARKKAEKQARKFAESCYSARPDLAPQWEGGAA